VPPDDVGYDRLWKVRYLLDTVNAQSKMLMTAGQALSLDEMMIKSRARISWLVRVVSKPIKDGIKAFALCAPDGYCFDFLLQSWSAADRKRHGAAFKRTFVLRVLA
jgi:hypothetical protein